MIISRKWISLEIGAASVLAVAVSHLGLAAQAQERQCGRPLSSPDNGSSPYYGSSPDNGSWPYHSSATPGNGYYDTTTVWGMLQARRGFWARPLSRPAPLPQGADYAQGARQRDSRQSRPDVVGRRPAGTAPQPSRKRMSNPDGWIDNLNEPDASSLGNAPQTLSPAAAAAPPHSIPPAPVAGGTNAAAADGGGASRGAGAPTNVDSPTESANRFRDEADAQSSKPPSNPGSPRPNR